MPLRDHFRPPLSDRSSWEALHGGWPMVIVQQLGKLLPEQYVAEPRVHLGSQIEIDIATFSQESNDSPSVLPPDAQAGAVWSPTEPTVTLETELGEFDEYEVQVFDVRRGRRLVAAVELVSPSNKDRPENRQQFTAKCASLLRRGVSVMIVDMVTTRHANLLIDLLQMIGEKDVERVDTSSSTYAATCRWLPRGKRCLVDIWHDALSVGEILPCLPLWLASNFAIPLDLEASYEQTCRDLRIA